MQRRADCPMCGHLVGVVTHEPASRLQFGQIVPAGIRLWVFRIVAVCFGLFAAGALAAGILYLAGWR